MESDRENLEFIGFRKAPFDAMSGATSIAQALFYAAHDDHPDYELGRSKQRE